MLPALATVEDLLCPVVVQIVLTCPASAASSEDMAEAGSSANLFSVGPPSVPCWNILAAVSITYWRQPGHVLEGQRGDHRHLRALGEYEILVELVVEAVATLRQPHAAIGRSSDHLEGRRRQDQKPSTVGVIVTFSSVFQSQPIS